MPLGFCLLFYTIQLSTVLGWAPYNNGSIWIVLQLQLCKSTPSNGETRRKASKHFDETCLILRQYMSDDWTVCQRATAAKNVTAVVGSQNFAPSVGEALRGGRSGKCIKDGAQLVWQERNVAEAKATQFVSDNFLELSKILAPVLLKIVVFSRSTFHTCLA